MCGICGFFAGHTARPKPRAVLDMWAEMEERGKDAAGFAASVSGRLWSLRAPKPASRLAALVKDPKIREARSWIGHCRLTTQGSEQNNENNHPFVRHGLALVHNGMVFNYYDLAHTSDWGELKGECDSELILAAILKYRRRRGVTRAIQKMARKLDGPMACALISRQGELWLWRREGDGKYAFTPITLATSADTPNLNFASTRRSLMPSTFGKFGWDVSALANNEGVHAYMSRGKLVLDKFSVPDCEEESAWYSSYGDGDYDPFDYNYGERYASRARWCKGCSVYYVNRHVCRATTLEDNGFEANVRGNTGAKSGCKSVSELKDDAIYVCEDCGVWLVKEEVLEHKVRNAHYTYREELLGEEDY